MTAKDLVKTYYEEMRKRNYNPIEYWGRDGKAAKNFLASGRTPEDFSKLLNKAFVGPKDIQIAVCQGLHRFMYLLPKIELLDEAPWEPSVEERAANIKLIETAAEEIVKATRPRQEKQFIKNPDGGWMRAPQS